MDYAASLLTVAGINIILALGLNLITGYCGQISLGHAAFYGMGAYCAALMAKAGWPFFAVLLPAMAVAGVLGIVVGFAALRVRHDFLAITTMGVGFLFLGIVRQQEWLGGEMGIYNIPGAGLDSTGYMLLTLGFAALAAALSAHIKRSWMGRVFNAIADDEDAALTAGVNVAGYKLAAFAIGTAMAGLAGALYAHGIRYVGPESFGFVDSVAILCMVVVGGVGSVPGVIAGALLLTLLPQLLQVVSDYRLLLYGGLLFLVTRFSPGGMAGMARAIAAAAGRPRAS
ncbi:MAG: branched-chain amino acid ABC transporter permease [Gammaproteobacteria bacterium]|nr:branched-chain amino acid ABC transporter permease [Gammaproteobacteria bacterium]